MTQIFLGYPPEHIKNWIIENSKPVANPKTKITFKNGDVVEYDWKGDVTIQTMIEAGLVNPKVMENPGITDVWLREPKSVEIGTDVTGLVMTFYMCGGLTGVTIPDSVSSIGEAAFFGCSSLTGVTIPNSVSSIGEAAFYMCDNLTSIVVEGRTTKEAREMLANALPDTSIVTGTKKSVTKITFADGTSKEYDLSGDVTLQTMTDVGLYDGSSWIKEPQTVEIGTEVTGIGDSVFQGCTGLTNVMIPDSATSIGSSTFSGCSGLTSVTIPDSVTSIGQNAFASCIGLTNITVPNSVTSIRDSVFQDCTGLTSVTIPNSVTSIGSSAFSGCSGLTSVVVQCMTTPEARELLANAGLSNIDIVIGDATIITFADGTSQRYSWSGDITQQTMTDVGLYDGSSWIKEPQTVELGPTVTSTGEYAFSNCSSLTSIIIPNSVTSVGNGVFSKTNITNITIPDSVTNIGEFTFDHCSSLTSVTIGNGVTSIGDLAFQHCNTLMDVTIPNSVTCIEFGTFSGCTSLSNVTIPNSVISFEYGAFRFTALTNVTIPDSVTSIDNDVFYDCSSLTSMTFSGKDKATVQGMANYSWGLESGCVIHCTDGDITI